MSKSVCDLHMVHTYSCTALLRVGMLVCAVVTSQSRVIEYSLVSPTVS